MEAGGVANGTAGTDTSSITLTKNDVDGTASYDETWLTSNGWATSDLGATYTKAGTYGTATLTFIVAPSGGITAVVVNGVLQP